MVRLRAPALALILVVALQAGTTQAAYAADATTVQVTQRYAINATLDVAAGTLDAVETVSLTNRAYRSILNAVRFTMGDADFFAALRGYLADHRYGMTTTRQLLDHLDAWNMADLLPIYQAYLQTYDSPPRRQPAPLRSKLMRD